MTLSNSQKAILHVAKARLGLDDACYRSALVQIAGVTSSTELDREGFEAVMGYFEWLGFRPLQRQGPDYGDRPGMATFAQLDLIRTMWGEWTGNRTEDGLSTWLMRCWRVSSLRFLSKGNAQKAITALKAMKARSA